MLVVIGVLAVIAAIDVAVSIGGIGGALIGFVGVIVGLLTLALGLEVG